jgi:hypothetical protein
VGDHAAAALTTNVGDPVLEFHRAYGVVKVWALGEQRFSIRAPAREEEIVVGFDAASERAQRLARGLD